MNPYVAFSEAHLDRIWRRAWARMTRYDGYQPFDHDWPTVRAVYPGWYAVLRAIRIEFSRRHKFNNSETHR